jgi:hypothetical protein
MFGRIFDLRRIRSYGRGDLRRYAPAAVLVNNGGGQVNVASQQINLSRKVSEFLWRIDMNGAKRLYVTNPGCAAC